MANDTQSSRKIKDNESNNPKGRHNTGKELTSSGSATSDASGLRRSPREALLKRKMTPSPPSSRKSERLDKQRLTPDKSTRKSERIEKKRMQSPLRRSDRGKKLSSLSSSGSKKSDSSFSSSDLKQRKEKKEKSVKLLTMETKEAGRSEIEDVESAPFKRKLIDARTYRALFVKQSKNVSAAVHCGEQSRLDKFSHGGSSNSGVQVGGASECSKRREDQVTEQSVGGACKSALVGANFGVNKFSKATLQDNIRVDQGCNAADKISESLGQNGVEASKSSDSQLSSYDAVAKDTTDDTKRVEDDCFVKENFQTPKLIDSKWNEMTVDGDLENLLEVIPLNGIRKSVGMNADASAIVATDETCTQIADAISSLPSGDKRYYFAETCGTCFDSQRVDPDSTRQFFGSSNTNLSLEFCDNSINKDRGKAGATVTSGYPGNCETCLLQKESFPDCQTQSDQNTCVVCKLGGKLLCCQGRACRRSYHLSCLDPPLEDVPLGVWLCIACCIKKMESGVHSVSEGVESIWDEREVDVSDVDGLQNQKQYFVKYKGLAHVHNQWLPESQLLLETPCLVAEFNQKNQVTRWKQEWTLPHRLLQKRLLVSSQQCAEYHEGPAGDNRDCHYEWLVKWHGLNYEHATWELENSSFLNSPEGQDLVRDYENRRWKSKLTSSVDKVPEREKSSIDQESHLASGTLPGFDNCHPDYVNKLRQFWDKHQNAVVMDDEEHIVKAIALILTLQPDVQQPFLVISSSAALSAWDDEFLHLAPSLDVVVYSGNEDIRRSIRRLEFYEESGCLLFQVLITSPEVIMMDIDVLGCINWEAIIMDECQNSIMSSYFESIKMLSSNWRLLLVNDQLKDSKDEYLRLLSLLECQSDLTNNDSLRNSSNDSLCKLKERLSRYIAYRCKLDSSRLLEYWVPAQLSNLQLEQYCAILLSNSLALRSPSKNDSVGALRDILISTRKLCNHPYIVDPSVQSMLTKNLQEGEYLDVGVKASGKLQLLDMMLMEIKKQGLRALLLFQSNSGSGELSLGDILDDFLRQRFGPDSYERVEPGILPSKKAAALNKFNNKESGRFVFLLEFRACLPSIKLSSVDTVIMLDSDWTPINNLKALQKITLDSQLEQIKIFRLYSSFTVEENVLILAKENKVIDGLQNISRSTSHMLLMLGVSHLFDRLDGFHGANTPNSHASTKSEQPLLKDVVQEFLSILVQNAEGTGVSNLSMILKVEQVGGTYSSSSLPGEHKGPLLDEAQPHMFWTKLLDGKHLQSKYSSGSSQRNRKRVLRELPRRQTAESDQVVKKHKKALNSNADPQSLNPQLEERIISADKEGADPATQSLCRSTALVNDNLHAQAASTTTLDGISELQKGSRVESEDQRTLHDEQESLHLALKPQLEKLAQILKLSEDVKGTIEKFLEYVMNNHHVNREPSTILEAFQISLCWTAASLLKYKIDHKESLALVKQHLDFDCKKEEVDYVYSLLRCLKNIFLYRTGQFKGAMHSSVSSLAIKGVTKELSPARLLQSTTSKLQKGKVEVEALSLYQESSNEHLASQQGLATEFKIAKKDVSKSIKEIHKKCKKQLIKLIQKQQKEKDEIKRTTEEEKAQLEKKHRMESTVIRAYLQSNSSMRIDKLKILDSDYAKRIEALDHQMEIRLKHVEEMQLAAREKVLQREALWVEEVKSWAQVELLNKTPADEPRYGVKCLKTCERIAAHDGQENVALVSGHLSEEPNPDRTAQSLLGHGLEFYETSETVPEEAVGCCSAVETPALLLRQNSLGGEFNKVPEGVSVIGFESNNRTGRSGDDQIIIDSGNPCSKELNPDKATSSKLDAQVPLKSPETVNPSDEQNVIFVNQPFEEQIAEQSSVPDERVPLGVLETVNSSNGPENFFSVSSPLSNEETPNGSTSSMPDRKVQSRVSEMAPGEVVEIDNVNNQNDEANAVPLDSFTGANQEDAVSDNVNQDSHSQANGSTSSMPDRRVQSRVSEMAPGEVVEIDNVNNQNDEANAVPPDSFTGANQEDAVNDNVNQDSHSQANGSTSSMPDRRVQLRVSEMAPGEVVEIDNVNNQNDEANAVPSDSFTGANQEDAVGDNVNQNSHSRELSLVNSPSVQPMTTTDLGSPSPFDQAPPDESTLPSTSAGLPTGEAPANDMQNSPQQIEPSVSHKNDALPSVTESVIQMQLSSTNSRSGNSTPVLHSATGVEDLPSPEVHMPNQLARTSMELVERPIELSDQAALQLPTSCALHLPIDVPIGGLGTQFSGMSLPIASEFSNHSVQTTPPVVSHMPLALYTDPLQTELERIRKEIDQTIKGHEDTKLQLKSDCEKEIEAVVAQIHRKYESKIQETEAEFISKKKELEVNHDKVVMNKFLAEAFRSKCMDPRASGPSGKQDVNSSFTMHLVDGLVHRNAQGPSLVGPSSISLSASILQSTSVPAASPRIASPPVQSFNHASSVYLNVPTRPPNISSISPPTGNLLVNSEIRAPAPHIQPFRPGTSICATSQTSLPRALPSQQVPSNTHSLGHLPPRAVARPAYLPVPYNNQSQFPALPNSSLSGANPPTAPQQPDVCTNRDPLMPPECGTSSVQVDASHTGGGPDVVCLSDDD